MPDKKGAKQNRGEIRLKVRSKTKKRVKKQANSQLDHDEIFFEEVKFTEWYFRYNLSPKLGISGLFWWCSDFSKSRCLKTTTLRPTRRVCGAISSPVKVGTKRQDRGEIMYRI